MGRKNGRCAVVLPQGVLFRGNKEGEIRKQFIESDKLDCVITLANNLFYGATIPACILVFRNSKPDSHKGQICLIDASSIYTPQRAQNIMSETDVEQVFNLYADYIDVPEKVSILRIEDLRVKGFTLSVNTRG